MCSKRQAFYPAMIDSNFSSAIGYPQWSPSSSFVKHIISIGYTCEFRILIFACGCVWFIWKHAMEKAIPLACFICGIFVLPIVCVALPLLYLYRCLVEYLLKKQKGSFYGGLIDGPDVMWAMELAEARSIITILLTVEKSSRVSTTAHDLLNMIRCMAENYFFVQGTQFRKLRYLRRKTCLGYYFWHACPDLKIIDFVRPLINNEGGHWSEGALKRVIGETCNKPMPHDDCATWEILVGQEPLEKDPCLFPVIVRMHHCVGDGAALVGLLLATLGDPPPSINLHSHSKSDQSNGNKVLRSLPQFNIETTSGLFVFKDSLLIMVVAVIVSVICTKRSLQTLAMTVVPAVTYVVRVLYLTPYVLYKETFGKTSDGVLHGKNLSGKKVIAWVEESDAIFLKKIRRIRRTCGQRTKFTDVLLTCLSRSLVRFYKERDEPLPDSFYVVLPARIDMHNLLIRRKVKTDIKTNRSDMEQRQGVSSNNAHLPALTSMQIKKTPSSDALQLENKFSVAMINLPLLPMGSDFGHNLSLIQKERERLGSSPDYVVNYWFLGWVTHLVPVFLLRPFLSSGPCSMVLSNLPGPFATVSINKNPIHGIAFWVPNRGFNGIGISILSYCERLSIGIIADKALMTAEEVKSIITGVIREIDDYHAIHTFD